MSVLSPHASNKHPYPVIAEKFQETHDFSELQSAVILVPVKVSSKFRLFCAAFVELYQTNFDLETFIEMNKSEGVASKVRSAVALW